MISKNTSPIKNDSESALVKHGNVKQESDNFSQKLMRILKENHDWKVGSILTP